MPTESKTRLQIDHVNAIWYLAITAGAIGALCLMVKDDQTAVISVWTIDRVSGKGAKESLRTRRLKST